VSESNTKVSIVDQTLLVKRVWIKQNWKTRLKPKSWTTTKLAKWRFKDSPVFFMVSVGFKH